MMPSRFSFELKEGTDFVVPFWADSVLFTAKKADQHPETPLILPLRPTVGGKFEVIPPKRSGSARQIGRHLFVPRNTKPGRALIIVWVSERSAAARFMTKDELTEAAAAAAKLTNYR